MSISSSSSLDLFSNWATEHENKSLQDFASIATLNRYLVAFEGNLERAKTGLEATVEWRSKSIIPTFVCTPCARNKGAHCFIALGEDKEGH